jgi:putative phosphoesterase
MLVLLADTHATEGHKLTPHMRTAVEDAAVVLHAGDFTTPAVYEALAECCDTLHAVAGNNDAQALCAKLPAFRTTDWGGVRWLLVHGHDHSETALAMLARQEKADMVVHGHSHRPGIDRIADRPLINPGSYAQPRQYEAAYVEATRESGAIRLTLRTPSGREITEECHPATE